MRPVDHRVVRHAKAGMTQRVVLLADRHDEVGR